jgi:hypothetical protein
MSLVKAISTKEMKSGERFERRVLNAPVTDPCLT